MARYVLVEFDDDDKARAFVEKINGAYAVADPESPRRFRVRAVWGKATRFCECTRSSNKMWAFTRGIKSGWWIHADCGRPKQAWAEGVHWFESIGRNLLPGNADFVPTGWGLEDKTSPSGVIRTTGAEAPDPRAMAKAERRAKKSDNRKLNPRKVVGPWPSR